MEDTEVRSRFDDFDARLIAQEHRLFTVLQNFFVERKKWPPNDPKRDAAAKAFLWCLFFSPGTVAFTGAVIGLATLAVLVWQNALIKQQNDYFREQISQQQLQIETQDRLNKQSQRDAAIRAVYGTEFRDTPRVKAEAIRTLVVIERSNIAAGLNVLPSDYVDLHNADLKNVIVERFDLTKVSFQWSDLSGARLMSISLKDSSFRFCNLLKANLYGANLTGTFWDSANLQEADLMNADISKANLVRANLRGANLEGIKGWESAHYKDANIFGVRNAPNGFVEFALGQGAVQDGAR